MAQGAAREGGRGSGALARWVPALGWLPAYRRSWLPRDVIAGLTVWALAVPESMAYAAIAGVPVQYGLYALPLALLGYALFGGCRQLFVGPSATVASISAVAVGAVGAGSDPERMVVTTAVLALLVGVLYIVLGLLRLGFVARFFAKPVLDGFIIGLGLFIAVGQLPKLVGLDKPDGNTVMVALRSVGHLGSWQWTTVLVGGLALAALYAMARWAPRLPGALIVAAAGIAAVPLLDLSDRGVEVVGEIPLGFDLVAWSGVEAAMVLDLVPAALAIILVGFSQSVAIAKAYGAKGGYRVDPNQEMIGYGVANLGAGALQGFTVTGSLSKSAAAEDAGGRTPVVLVTTAVVAVPTVLFAAGLFENLPEAVLAAVVIHAVSGMIGIAPLVRLWRNHRGEFVLAAGSLLGVVLVGILVGVVVGVVLSFALLIRRIDHPHVALLGRDGAEYRDLRRHPGAQAVPGALIYRFDAPLVFANAEAFADDVMARVAGAERPPRAVILDFTTIGRVDTTGAASLVDLVGRLRGRGIEVRLADAIGPVESSLRTDGVIEVLGESHLHRTVDAAARVVEARSEAGAEEEPGTEAGMEAGADRGRPSVGG